MTRQTVSPRSWKQRAVATPPRGCAMALPASDAWSAPPSPTTCKRSTSGPRQACRACPSGSMTRSSGSGGPSESGGFTAPARGRAAPLPIYRSDPPRCGVWGRLCTEPRHTRSCWSARKTPSGPLPREACATCCARRPRPRGRRGRRTACSWTIWSGSRSSPPACCPSAASPPTWTFSSATPVNGSWKSWPWRRRKRRDSSRTSRSYGAAFRRTDGCWTFGLTHLCVYIWRCSRRCAPLDGARSGRSSKGSENGSASCWTSTD